MTHTHQQFLQLARGKSSKRVRKPQPLPNFYSPQTRNRHVTIVGDDQGELRWEASSLRAIISQTRRALTECHGSERGLDTRKPLQQNRPTKRLTFRPTAPNVSAEEMFDVSAEFNMIALPQSASPAPKLSGKSSLSFPSRDGMASSCFQGSRGGSIARQLGFAGGYRDE